MDGIDALKVLTFWLCMLFALFTSVAIGEGHKKRALAFPVISIALLFFGFYLDSL